MRGELTELPVRNGFRMRGESVSRLETFVDAAFAFAVTMMVISVGELPRSYGDLMSALHRVPTFACCFLILMLFWNSHNRWSRRYGLETPRTVFLSLALVLVVLIWLYPLRMVIAGGLAFVTRGWVPSEMGLQSTADLQDCFLVYGIGFGTLSAIMLQLYRVALAAADELGLDSLERLETRRELGSYAILLAVAAASMTLTFVVREERNWIASLPGFAYGLTAPAMHFHHSRFHKLRSRLAVRSA